eukprot:6477256-Amphidinium_carterae.1
MRGNTPQVMGATLGWNLNSDLCDSKQRLTEHKTVHAYVRARVSTCVSACLRCDMLTNSGELQQTSNTFLLYFFLKNRKDT